MSSSQQRRFLRSRGTVCHYCDRQTDTNDPNRYPTKDHIVPKAFGGPNSMDNYVLACRKCNNDRGTSLFYCDCRDCREKIYDALYDRDTMNRIFTGIVAHNRPRVYRISTNYIGPENWSVRIGHGQKKFVTFEEAIEFANTGTMIEDKNYG